MKIKGIHLSWIMVSDLKKSKDFFTKILGLNLFADSPEHSWAEVKAPEGSTIGIGQAHPAHPTDNPGQNAVITFTVDNIEQAKQELINHNVRLEGDIMEVPGHVKMLTFFDLDGNKFQLVELLSE